MVIGVLVIIVLMVLTVTVVESAEPIKSLLITVDCANVASSPHFESK
jgi:hypothetical protein